MNDTHKSNIKCLACGKKVNLQIVKKENNNKGRPFYSCRQCNEFFLWADNPTDMARYHNKITARPVITTARQIYNSNPPGQASASQNIENTSHNTNDRSKLSVKPIEIKFVFYDKDYLIVRGYQERLLEFWRRLEYATFIYEAKGWRIPSCQYENCTKELKKLNFPVEFNTFPHHILKLFAADSNKSNVSNTQAEADITSKISPQLWQILMPFQKEGVIEVITKGGRVLIGDEMGLGKTIQALTICSYYREWPVLVICPSSLRLTWSNEIQRWLQIPEEEIQVIFNGSNKLQSPMAKFVIVSYDLCRTMGHTFNKKFNVVIADEAHYLKNRSAKRSQVCLRMIQETHRAILLTGTPALSRPEELYGLIEALNNKLFPNFTYFASRYCNRKLMHLGHRQFWDTKGSQNLEELHWLMAKTILIRRLKKDVNLQLPAKTRAIIKIKIDRASMKPIEELKAKKAKLDESGDQESLYNIKREKQILLNAMWEQTAQIKLPGIIEYVSDLYESTEKKFLVFAHHHVVLDGFSKDLDCKSINYIRIDGSVPSAKRQVLVDQFQNDSSIRIALLSITAANTGLTLTAADLVVFAELYWNPATLLQAEDRAHRIGRNERVDIKYILADGTADDIVWPLIKKKLQIVGLMLDNSSNKININEGTTFGHESQSDLLEWFNETVGSDDNAGIAFAAEENLEEPSRGIKRTRETLDFSYRKYKKTKNGNGYGNDNNQ
ncbi:12272_t:CDS:10 [Ambispora leptoticha]|uniref:12272_t:CDS:1 n=1 Tax=Ambispora leptoticha TaxID=144679 RepID=A0A9N9G6Y0_9GLOM|nr:12272_t:CDS:10 [Ambispora leptoticha]